MTLEHAYEVVEHVGPGYSAGGGYGRWEVVHRNTRGAGLCGVWDMRRDIVVNRQLDVPLILRVKCADCYGDDDT